MPGALCFLLGVLLVQLLPELPAPCTILLFGAGALVLAATRIPGRVLWLGVLGGCTYASGYAALELERRLDPAWVGREVEVHGRIVELPERFANGQRFLFNVERPPNGVPGRIRLTWYDAPRLLSAGERWRFSVRLQRPRGFRNPAGFDFEAHALRHGIAATGWVVGKAPFEPLAAAAGLPWWRESISRAIATALPDGPARAMVQALAVGDTRALSDEDWRLFRVTGITHLIAISGLHIGFVAALGGGLGWILTWLWPTLCRIRPRAHWMAATALLSAFGYCLLAGFEVPAQRTLLMITAFLAATWCDRVRSLWDGYALALVAVLLLNPLEVLGAGFWLSFVAVAWLLVVFGTRRPPLRGVRELLASQLLLTLALLPIGLAFFQQASWLAPFANLLAVPWITFLAVPLILLGMVVWPLAPSAAPWLWWSAERALALLLEALWAVEGWTAWAGHWPAPSWPAVLLASAATLGIWFVEDRRWRLLALCLYLPVFALRPHGPSPGDFELWVFDVGQGQAVLVRTARHALLVDAGPGFPGGGERASATLLPSLHQLGVRRLADLVLTHDDLDHSGGAMAVREALPTAELWTSATQVWPEARACLAGDGWDWDGVRFEFLHPTPGLPYLDNDSSCVLRIAGRQGRALLTGDIGALVEQRLLRDPGPAGLAAEVLLLSHHGSRSANGQAFLEAVRPTLALVSAGHRNRFGHPHPEVVERVGNLSAELANTGTDGALRVRWHGGRPVVERWRERTRRYWHER